MPDSALLLTPECLTPMAAPWLERLRQAATPVLVLADDETDATRAAQAQATLTAAGLGADLALLTAERPGQRPPAPGLVLRGCAATGLSPERVWLATSRPAALMAAASAGCLGAVALGGAAVPAGVLLHVVVARDLVDAPRVMVPPGGGCWHDHRR
jgi:hypothetical protein